MVLSSSLTTLAVFSDLPTRYSHWRVFQLQIIFPSSRSTSLSLSIPSFTVCHSIPDISPSVNMNHRFFQASKNRLHSIFAPSPKIFAEILNPVPRGAVPTIHVHHPPFMSSLALEPSESLPVCPLPAPASKCCWSLVAPVGYSPFLP